MFLHAVAVVATAIFMPLALYWFLYSEADTLQRRAMHQQAESLLAQLKPRADGQWSFDIPQGLHDLYSEAYGRYAYAVRRTQGPEYLFQLHAISEVWVDLACNHKAVGPNDVRRRDRHKPSIVPLILAETIATPVHELCKALA
jgi:hypothetical protein